MRDGTCVESARKRTLPASCAFRWTSSISSVTSAGSFLLPMYQTSSWETPSASRLESRSAASSFAFFA